MAELVTITGSAFPREDVDPKEKVKKDWLLQYARAAYGNYYQLGDKTIGAKSASFYEEWRKYSQGKQDVNQYKKTLTPGSDPSENKMVVQWKILPVLPRFRRTAIGLIQKGQDYKVAVDPIDSFARSEMTEELNLMRAKILMRDALQKQGMEELTGLPELQQLPNEPEDLDGVEVAETGMRHKIALEAEQVVELVNNQNNYERLRKYALEDLFDFGAAVVKDYEEGHMIKQRKVDLRRLVMNYCHNVDFSDLRYIGEILAIPPTKMEVMSQGQITKDQLATIYNQAQGFNFGANIPSLFGNFGTFESWWDNGSVFVLDLEIKSVDTTATEVRVDKRGNLQYGKVKPKKADPDNIRKVENIYRIKWVIGTDICFDYGKLVNIKLNPRNKACAKFSYHIVAADIHNMEPYSRTEAIIPIIDAIQLKWYKLQHTLNSAVPKGPAIDLSALEEVSLSAGGKKMTPKEILNLYFQRGVLLFRSKGPTSQQNKWIEELANGIGNELAEYYNGIVSDLNLIRQTLGLNDLTDASTPNPKTLTTIANLAAVGTNNALSDLFDADRELAQQIAESVIIRAQYLIKDGKGEAFIESLGYGTMSLLKHVPAIDKYTFGATIVAKPDTRALEAFEKAVETAMASNQITIDQYIRAKNIQNLKQAELYLAYQVRKNREIQQQMAMQQVQQNAQVQQQSAVVAEEERRKTLELEYKLKADLAAQQHREKLEQISAEGQLRLEEERISATGRVEASYIQAKERQESNVRNNATKLLNDDKDEKVGLIDIKDELKSTVQPATSPENPYLEVEEIPEEFSFLPEAQ